ncbi:Secretion-regulating guanine nucleotide exchange factor [Cercospora zeina]
MNESSEYYKLFAFGSNGSGQLGIGHTEDVSSPHECTGFMANSSTGLQQLASGGNHTIALLNDGTFAAAGDNVDGRCLMSTQKAVITSWMQERSVGHGNGVVKHVAATWSASFASGEHECYASGSGTSGELGLGFDVLVAEAMAKIERLIPHSDRIVKLASSMGHIVVVLASGEAWGWGRGRQGQLGVPAEVIWRPRKINNVPFKVFDAVCGKDFTCLFGDSSTGEYTILGLDRSDRFGVKKDAPDNISRWKQVAASWGSIYVLMNSGELFAWGRNDHGQLPPPDLPLLKAIAAGSEHCLGLTEDGRVLAWGWGEHGNCGTPTDQNGDIKGRWNQMAVSGTASAIFAGCATSFIVTKQQSHGLPS